MTETYTAPDATVSKWWWAKCRESGSLFLSYRNGHGEWRLVDSKAGLCNGVALSTWFREYDWQPLPLPEPTWPEIDPKPYLVYAEAGYEPRWIVVSPDHRNTLDGCPLEQVTIVDHPKGIPSDPEGVELIRQAKEKTNA